MECNYVNPKMATRKPSDAHASLIDCTFYCMHASQRSLLDGWSDKVIDYTEHKLKRYAASVTDLQQLATLEKLITAFIAGHVAVAWVRGRPVWQHVTRAA